MAIVDLAFRVSGGSIPADHGYLLYSAICKHVPDLHDLGADGRPNAGVHPIGGRFSGSRALTITSSSRLILRLNSQSVPAFLPLVGKQLSLGGSALQVGTPEVKALIPAARLYSRLVTIKNAMEPGALLEAVRMQLASLNVSGKPGLVRRQGAKALEGRSQSLDGRCEFVRRTLRIRDKDVVGFALEVQDLGDEDSVKLQETGLGGRRKFGCGVFGVTRR